MSFYAKIMTDLQVSYPRFLANGDRACSVEFGDSVDRAIAARVVSLARRISRLQIDGIVELVPTFRSLLIHFDPDRVSQDHIRERALDELEEPEGASGPARRWTIPACYDPTVAPDIEEVAAHAGLDAKGVADCHASETYFVYMMGFLPGYPYLGDVPGPLVLPRRTDPRTRVPAGSVAIAQTMTAVYTLESPGGWHLIGRTPVRFFDAEADPPALLAPGDLVCFEPVSLERLGEIEAEVRSGRFRIACNEVSP